MANSKKQKYKNIFDKYTKSKNIFEGILLIENSNGDFSFSKSYGGKELDTPILMASITKLLTTTCIFILLEQGKLTLNDKITKYFDNLILNKLLVYKNKDYSFELTIFDLLYQTSGLPDVYEEGNPGTKNKIIKEDFYFSFDEMIAWTKKLHPHFAPQSENKAHYADINFDILGEIIEKVSNLSLSKAYKHYIFEPLGLTDTYLAENENDFIPSSYYNNQLIHRPKFLISSRASGAGITTAYEMMIFIKAFFGGKLFDKNILNKLSGSNKLQPSMWPICYGSGYMKIPLNGFATFFKAKGELVGHSGSTGSFAFYYPLKDLFFVGDINQMANAALPIRLSMQLAILSK